MLRVLSLVMLFINARCLSQSLQYPLTNNHQYFTYNLFYRWCWCGNHRASSQHFRSHQHRLWHCCSKRELPHPRATDPSLWLQQPVWGGLSGHAGSGAEEREDDGKIGALSLYSSPGRCNYVVAVIETNPHTTILGVYLLRMHMSTLWLHRARFDIATPHTIRTLYL